MSMSLFQSPCVWASLLFPCSYFLGNLQSAKHSVACDVPRYQVDLDAPPEVGVP